MSKMARFDLTEITYEQRTLERMKVASRAALSPSVASSLDLRAMQDHMTERMIYELRAEVLAERVLDTDAEVTFSGTRHVETTVRVRALWLPFLVAAVVCLVGVFAASLGAVIASGVIALLGSVLLYLNPADNVTLDVPVDGTVTVPATYWRKFPEAEVVYPKDLRGPVRYAVMGEPSYRSLED